MTKTVLAAAILLTSAATALAQAPGAGIYVPSPKAVAEGTAQGAKNAAGAQVQGAKDAATGAAAGAVNNATGAAAGAAGQAVAPAAEKAADAKAAADSAKQTGNALKALGH